MREPLTWPGGVRQSASGLVVEVLTDEGICGFGEAPGPTLPTIRTVIEQELTQFLVGRTRCAPSGSSIRMEEFSRNWSASPRTRSPGLEIALLDLKGKALGAPVVELLGGVCSDRVPVVGYLFIDEPEANARKAKAFVGRRLHGAQAQGRPRLRPGSRRDRGDPRRGRADVKLRIDANMIWSVPPPIKWIRGSRSSTSSTSSSRSRLRRRQGLAQVRRSVSCRSRPTRRARTCAPRSSSSSRTPATSSSSTRPRREASRGHGRSPPIAEAAGQVVRDRELGRARPATIANAHLAAATSTFAFASDTHYPLQSEDVLTQPLDMSDGLLAVPRSPGLGVELDRAAMARLANNQVRESVFYDDIHGEAPRVGQIL
jgi:L-alanine-DL-glutamate epimerase-like enolase superfamily enzyme